MELDLALTFGSSERSATYLIFLSLDSFIWQMRVIISTKLLSICISLFFKRCPLPAAVSEYLSIQDGEWCGSLKGTNP